jgi:O-6-methylguanine DNA methyltransferase
VNAPIDTKEGKFIAIYSTRGLARLHFPNCEGNQHGLTTDLRGVTRQMLQWHLTTTRAVEEVLAGRTPSALPPLDLTSGTEFRQRVWDCLRQIATGETRSYAEVAAGVGQPKATRAVGSACGANPIPVLIPCHRVLAANRGLGGFSGGLEWKRKLLAIEGIRFTRRGVLEEATPQLL